MSDAVQSHDRWARFGILPRVGWGVFLLLLVLGAVVAVGAPMSAVFLVGSFLAVLLAWVFPYQMFYLAASSGLLLGLLVSVSTGELTIGNRVFGASIDVTVGELLAGAVTVAWALRILTLWRGRRDTNWRPWLPAALPFAGVVVAHTLSVFSPTHPDPLLILKYSLRPVLLAYIISVALTVNFVRSRRRLKALLLCIIFLAMFFAFDGFRSLFVFGFDLVLYRARPLFHIGALNPLGGNHNALAQMMLLGAPLALAYAALERRAAERNLVIASAGFMSLIALLTFARSAWIAFACMIAFLSATVWRSWIKAHRELFLAGGVLFAPLAVYMIVFSLSDAVQGSTDSRAMLAQIALFMFTESPLVGFGAGTFVEQVGRVYAFVVEFGAPLDSHGLVQKLAAETGLIGLAAFGILAFAIIRIAWKAWTRIRRPGEEAEAYLYLAAAVIGAFIYQLFDTTYWSPRLWLPIGLLLAAGAIFARMGSSRDPDFLNPDG